MFVWNGFVQQHCAVLGLHTALLEGVLCMAPSLYMNSDLVVSTFQSAHLNSQHYYYFFQIIIHLLLCVFWSFHNRNGTVNRSVFFFNCTADCVLGRLEVKSVRHNGDDVTEEKGQVEVKRQEDRQAKLRLRLWVVAGGRGTRRRYS